MPMLLIFSPGVHKPRVEMECEVLELAIGHPD